MYLPPQVQFCIETLEKAGHCAYAVGGCVRDSILGLTPHDYDLCTNATPEQLQQIFSAFPLVLSGIKHGTVGVIIDHQNYEITTFRTEGGYTDSRHPGWVEFVGNVEQDLARRDFTVNAMAYNPKEGYIDPWGGQNDLKNKILRTVGDPEKRFREDALRILRGVRFAIRFDLTPEENTIAAMEELSYTMEGLSAERIFDELCKILVTAKARDVLGYRNILTQVLPELSPCVDFQQHTPYHIHDVYTHTAHVTDRCPQDLVLRWSAILHDIGKPPCFTMDEKGQGHFYGHAAVSAQLADGVLRRLKAPTALREQVVTLIKLHMNPLQPDKKQLTRLLSKHGWDTVEKLLLLQQADFGANTPDYGPVEKILDQLRQEDACLQIKDLAVNGQDLMALGIAPGPELGKLLKTLLNLVQEEQLQNERETLLNYVEEQR